MYKFEDKLEQIETALEKKRSRWDLDAVPSVDYDDIKQIIKDKPSAVPQFLRTAKNLSNDDWEKLSKMAEKMEKKNKDV